MEPFAYNLDEEDIKRERRKARELRNSQWMDHIVPIARGGRSTKGNVVAACKECNNAKKQLLPMEWEEYLKEFRTNTDPVK